jgi:tetratricopeptide (TPR) repeat protein
MDSPFFLFLIGLLFILLFGGLSLMRREGLSLRFAVESLVFTCGVALLTWGLNFSLHPAIFLLALYLVTLRIRLLVDIGNWFARRRDFNTAEKIYLFANRLWTDNSSRLILHVNQGTLRLQQGALDEAILIFRNLLSEAPHGLLGIRYETAAHYNLGIAYLRKGLDAQAVAEFNTVLDIWPASEFSRAASNALARHRRTQSTKPNPE